ncbi:sigma-70 family RNA polymerase sigma factor [Tepidiforma sp.]|uniref:sigma-70 family RNA polymerase sigma factor n=1 Tax=Tepidiforma sp. TaxID=2682230 RepID=UPI002ADD8EC2|nr:sigma-70 family RNA polymerase sigma factor [Tepidiforma sp.]
MDPNPSAAGIRNIDRTVEFSRLSAAELAERADWTDEALMHAILARDPHAFAVLYDRYVDLVYTAAYRILGDTGLAEDTVQDVFVRLWRRPETFIAERGRFISWLMSVTRNRAVDELRARGRRWKREGSPIAEPAEHAEPIFHQPQPDPLRSAELHDEQLAVRRALASLPREQQEVLELAYFGGLTQQQIAALLHEPLGTVKTRIRLGMQKLRRGLQHLR